MPLLDEFQEVPTLVGGELLRSEVVEDQESGRDQGLELPGVAAVEPCQTKVEKQAVASAIDDGNVVSACFVSECACEV